MKDQPPTVSIIVPMFNAEATIGRCLESLKAVDYPDLEVILVDDGSTDRTVEIASRYPWKMIRHPHRQGPGTARNTGAQAAQGKWLLFTDADCVVPPHWVQRVVKHLEVDGVAAVTGGYAGSVTDDFISRFQYEDLAYRHQSVHRHPRSSISSNFGCRRDVFFACGGFPATINEDMEIAYQMTKRHYLLTWAAEIGVYHHFKPSLGRYLKQQFSWVESLAESYLRAPELILAPFTCDKSQVVMEIFSSLLLLGGGIGLALWPGQFVVPAAITLAFFLGVEGPLLLWFLRRQGPEFTVKALGVMWIRNLNWCIAGIFSLLRWLIFFITHQKAPLATQYRYHG